MRTLPAAWERAYRCSTVTPVYLVRITLQTFPEVQSGGAVEIRRYAFTNARKINSLPYPTSVRSVAPVAAEVDPKTRKYTVGSITVDLIDDGSIRDVIAATKIHRKAARLDVYLGAEELAEADYLQIFRGTIDDVLPILGETVRISATDPRGALLDKNVDLTFTGKHPADVVAMLLADAGLTTSDYDLASLDPTSQQYVARGIAQFNLSLASGDSDLKATNRTTRNVSIRQAIDDLCFLMQSSLVPAEDGPLRNRVFDPQKPVSRTWSQADLDGFEQIENAAKIINKVTIGWDPLPQVEYGRGGSHQILDDPVPVAQKYSFEDFASQQQLGGVYEETFTSIFLPSRSWLRTTFDAIDTQLELANPVYYGLAGYRDPIPSDQPVLTSLTPPANRVTTTAPAYFQLRNEIVRATASFDVNATINHWEGHEGASPNPSRFSNLAVGSGVYQVERGAFNTPISLQYDESERAIDLTIPVFLGINLVERWAFGAPVIRVRTGLLDVDLEVSDLVSLTHDVYLAYGYPNGVDATAVFEIVRKEVDATSDSPGITWTLCWCRHTTFAKRPGPRHTVELPRATPEISLLRSGIYEDFGLKYCSGLTFDADPGALTGTVARGIAKLSGGRRVEKDFSTLAVRASKDSYLYLDTLTMGFVLRDVANGDPQPTHNTWEMPLSKIVSDSSQITGATDLRQLYPFDGSMIAPGTLPAPTIADHSIGWLQMATDYQVPLTSGAFGLHLTAPAAWPTGAALNLVSIDDGDAVQIVDSSGAHWTHGVVDQSRGSSFRKIWLGNGETSTTGVPGYLYGSDMSGNNVVGPALYIGSGASTGSEVGGAILFQTSPAGSSGTTLNTRTTRAGIDGKTGAFRLYATSDPDILAGQVSLYSKTSGGATELYWRDPAGNVGQLTAAGVVNAAAGSSADISIADASATAFKVHESTNNYLLVDTTNAAETVSIGNATTNPAIRTLGTGLLSLGGALALSAAIALTATSTPSSAAGKGSVYTRTVSAATELYYLDGAGNEVRLTGAGAVNLLDVLVPDASATAYRIREASNNYLLVDTTNAAETVSLGNATTNPQFKFLGTGLTTFGGNLSMPTAYAIGSGSHGTLGATSYAFGDAALAAGDDSLAIGSGASAGASGSTIKRCIAIGSGAIAASVSGAVAIGYGAVVTSSSILIGATTSGVALANQTQSGVVGIGSSCGTRTSAVAVGYSVVLGGNNATAVGAAAQAGDQSAGFGASGIADGASACAFGQGSRASASGSCAFGRGSGANSTDAIALGNGAQTSAANQFVVGADTHAISNVYVGNGVTNATASDVAFHATGGSGTNKAGANLALCAGLNTGTGTPGNINLQTGRTDGSTGATLSALITRFSVQPTSMLTNQLEHGEGLQWNTITEEITLSGTAKDTTISIPAGVLVLFAVARVTLAITGPASWMFGLTTDATPNRYGNTLALTLGTTVKNGDTAGAPQFSTGGTLRVRSQDGTTAFTAGKVRITVFYVQPVAPTS